VHVASRRFRGKPSNASNGEKQVCTLRSQLTCYFVGFECSSWGIVGGNALEFENLC